MPGSLALWMRPLGDINRPTLQMYLDNLEWYSWIGTSCMIDDPF
jgi:hypothetical protein